MMTCKEIVNIAKQDNVSEMDNGAEIIRLEEGNKPKPPVILVKTPIGFN